MNVKIKKEFWNLIAKGQKVLEFRKLESGIPTGKHTFISTEKCLEHKIGCDGTKWSYLDSDGCGLICECGVANIKENYIDDIFGTAHWKPVAINPLLFKGYANVPTVCILDMEEDHNDLDGDYDHIIDVETYKFVLENYISKGIDFIAYELTNIKAEK